jgi:hypothetical protein
LFIFTLFSLSLVFFLFHLCLFHIFFLLFCSSFFIFVHFLHPLLFLFLIGDTCSIFS